MSVSARRSCFVVVGVPDALGRSDALRAPRRSSAPEPPGGWPVVTVHGETWTQATLLQRNLGGPADQTTAFPPHRIVGNIYYVGTNSLASFLVATPQGHILINSSYERNVPVIQKSIEALGFKMSDVKILLGSHAHGDHMEGDAAVKALSGAQVVAMAEDVPALERMRPGGKAHPIDRVIHDGDTVTLGGTTLVAHLTPGHSRGCTTWTLKATEGGRSLDVVIVGSLGVNPGLPAGEQRRGAGHRRRVPSRLQGVAGLGVRRAAGLASGDVPAGAEVPAARQRRRQPLHRPGRLRRGAGPHRGDVPGRAHGAAEAGGEVTSTHSAPVSAASRSGRIRTAAWIAPAAGSTSSKSFSETSQ